METPESQTTTFYLSTILKTSLSNQEYRRQSWGIGGRDPSDFGMGSSAVSMKYYYFLSCSVYRNMR